MLYDKFQPLRNEYYRKFPTKYTKNLISREFLYVFVLFTMSGLFYIMTVIRPLVRLFIIITKTN